MEIFLRIFNFIFGVCVIYGYLFFWIEIFREKFNEPQLGGFIGIFVFILFIYFKDKYGETEYDKAVNKMERYGMLKTETDREILSYIDKKASEMNITPEEYIKKVKAYEKGQKE